MLCSVAGLGVGAAGGEEVGDGIDVVRFRLKSVPVLQISFRAVMPRAEHQRAGH